MTNILEQCRAIEDTTRQELLAEYRALLTKHDAQPIDADKLLELSRALGFPMSRLPADMVAVREVALLERQAGDHDKASEALETTFAASEKHRTMMEKKIAQLKVKQSELDAEVSSARGRAQRAENARKQLADLYREHGNLFPEWEADQREAEIRRLTEQAEQVETVREQLDAAQVNLEQAEEVLVGASNKLPSSSPHTNLSGIDEMIQAKTDAERARDGAVARLDSVRDRLEECEEAMGKLNRDEG